MLVERVEGFATEAEWTRGYDEINAFERMLTDDGMVLVKVWLHISEEEQLKRFEARAADPLKAYKLTDEDWRNRGKRKEYARAIEEMLERTSRWLEEVKHVGIVDEKEKQSPSSVLDSVADYPDMTDEDWSERTRKRLELVKNSIEMNSRASSVTKWRTLRTAMCC